MLWSKKKKRKKEKPQNKNHNQTKNKSNHNNKKEKKRKNKQKTVTYVAAFLSLHAILHSHSFEKLHNNYGLRKGLICMRISVPVIRRCVTAFCTLKHISNQFSV